MKCLRYSDFNIKTEGICIRIFFLFEHVNHEYGEMWIVMLEKHFRWVQVQRKKNEGRGG